MLRPALLLACAAFTLAACDSAEAPGPDAPSGTISGVAEATAPSAVAPGFTPSVGATPRQTAAPPSPKPTPTPSPTATSPDDATDACGASKVARWRTDRPSESVLAEIRRASGAGRIRVIRPGDVVTMDYSESRLNVHIGENGRIASFRCG